MADDRLIAPLEVADEAFLVTSMIERCPNTMMLRELVVNAIEAAMQAPPGEGLVEIEQRLVQGAPKLCIWNTGPGMSADELDRICDIAASIGKVMGLDGNFGMGAKVASLPSNKAGLVIRSCKAGRVNQVILGAQGGIYGRLLQEGPTAGPRLRVTDVTGRCLSGYDLSREWTEVVLYGNRPDQDTAADPFDGAPPMPPDWVMTSLIQRFFRIPKGVEIRLLPGVGAPVARTLRPLAAAADVFTRAESVALPGGMIAHYYYLAPAADGSPSAGPAMLEGAGGIVHRGEIYALRRGHLWALDAPSFGIPFGARHITVLLELPDDGAVRADAYREILRHAGDEQRPVALMDFAATVRDAMPAWLRQIVNALVPPPADYMAELQAELQHLVIELDMTVAAAPRPRAAATPPPPSGGEAPPPVRHYQKPPEIVLLRDDQSVAEHGLATRAARYVPASRHLFVNARCAAMMRMALQLRYAFADHPDVERVTHCARDVAEWSVVRMIARSVLHALSKQQQGWTELDIARAQSPEALTIVADNDDIAFPAARLRLLAVLMPETDDTGQRENDAPSQDVVAALLRRETALSTAERMARRALALGQLPPAPFLRRLSEISFQRRDPTAALGWARKATEANPADAWSYNQLAAALMAAGAHQDARAAALHALQLAGETPHTGFYHRLSEIEARLGNPEAALDYARQAVAAAPGLAFAHSHLASILLTAGRLDEAETAALRATACVGETPTAIVYRRASEVAQRRGDGAAALAWARRAVAVDAGDAWSQFHLAGLLLETDLAAAERAARTAVSLSAAAPRGAFLRRLSEARLRLRDIPSALALAEQAVAVEPEDRWARNHLAALLRRTGDLARAEREIRHAIAQSGETVPSAFLRTLSEIRQARQDLPEATRLARQAIAANPQDAWTMYHLAGLLLIQDDLDGAETLAMRTLELSQFKPVGAFVRRVSEIRARRKDLTGALDWAERAVAADPRDPWGQNHLAGLLLARGELDRAEQAVRTAIELDTGLDTPRFEKLLRDIEARRAARAA